MNTLPTAFFNRPAPKVARDLIGCYLVVRRGGKIRRFRVTEAEAYDGFDDLASHAARGLTQRNQIMFREAGHIYVYFVYGMHWMLNVVTGPAGYPAAVLLRGAESSDGKTLYDGPGKLTKALGIAGDLNGTTLSRQNGLWVEPPKADAPRPKIAATPRIGVAYAGPVWSKKAYRFVAGKGERWRPRSEAKARGAKAP